MTKIATFHDLEGASVFITGGGSGIGASLTDGFMSQGAKVAFIGRSDASEFVDEMKKKYGVSPMFIQGNITDNDALTAAIHKAADAHGPITCLVNNAANDKRHSTEEVDEDFWNWMMAVKLNHQFLIHQLHDGHGGLPALYHRQFRH